MSWKPPATEVEWETCLSAYADGELDHDSASALEAHLERDAVHAQQLEALQKTSALLQSWTVDAPPMNARLRASLTNQPKSVDEPTQSFARYRGAFRMAAVFAMGVFAGVLMMNALRPTAIDSTSSIVADNTQDVSTEPAISRTQADAVFQEIEAAALTRRIKRDAREGRWENASSGLERIRAQYAGTDAAQNLVKAPAHRVMRIALQRRGQS